MWRNTLSGTLARLRGSSMCCDRIATVRLMTLGRRPITYASRLSALTGVDLKNPKSQRPSSFQLKLTLSTTVWLERPSDSFLISPIPSLTPLKLLQLFIENAIENNVSGDFKQSLSRLQTKSHAIANSMQARKTSNHSTGTFPIRSLIPQAGLSRLSYSTRSLPRLTL